MILLFFGGITTPLEFTKQAPDPFATLKERLTRPFVVGLASVALSKGAVEGRNKCLENCNKGDCSDENINCNNN